MNKKNFLKRCLVFVVGLFLLAMGIAISVKANLGISPISCVPYVYSLKLPLSMGMLSILLQVLFIILQIILLRKDFKPVQLLQLPVALLFGFFIDFTMFLVSGVQVTSYVMAWVFCLLSCVIVAFGIFLEVKANVMYLSVEGLALAIAKVYKKEFGKVKVGIDCTVVAVGIVSSFLMLHSLQGIREGTVASAILVGLIARVYGKKIKFVDAIVGEKDMKAEVIHPVEVVQQPKVIITIAREFGSGGHEIGEMVAQKLGISFYDTKLIELSAKESGLPTTYVMEHEQKLANTLLFELYEQNYAYVKEEMPPLDTLFMVQSKVIRDISEKESCVIVGRCADYILKGNSNCFNVFIHAGKKYRIARVMQEFAVDASTAEKNIEKTDRDRANYCRRYTHQTWKDLSNYNLTIDSSLFGSEESSKLIVEAVHKYFKISTDIKVNAVS
jgi:uncharacterized membrane protein YczE/cytidylate kinase